MIVVGVHVLTGLVAVVGALLAMFTPKGSRWHRRGGRIWLGGLGVLSVTATVLAGEDWARRWPLVLLGAVALVCAGFGFRTARRGGAGRGGHIVGMSMSFAVALTAFYVDNGPRLPVWDQLPPAVFWFLPTVVGVPLVLRALRRHAWRKQDAASSVEPTPRPRAGLGRRTPSGSACGSRRPRPASR